MIDRSRINQSFVARIWLERAKSGDPKWRGHVQHIQGQEEVYFQDLTELGEFLEKVTGIPVTGPTVAPELGMKATVRDTPPIKTQKAGKRRDN